MLNLDIIFILSWKSYRGKMNIFSRSSIDKQQFLLSCNIQERWIGCIIVAITESSLEIRPDLECLYCNVVLREILVSSPLSRSKTNQKMFCLEQLIIVTVVCFFMS